MSTFLIAAMLVAAAPVDGPSATQDKAATTKAVKPVAAENDAAVEKDKADGKKEPAAKPLTGTELKKATEAALRRWARCGDEQMSSAAAEFIVLYRDIQSDTELPRTTREKLRHKVRYRLLGLAPRIAKKAAIDRRIAQRAAKKAAKSTPSQSLADQPSEHAPANGAGGGGAWGNDDYGEQLVELIHTTVLPHTWDVNGGMGSMYYWRNGRALVVRQSQEAHEQLEHLLLQLRRAGN